MGSEVSRQNLINQVQFPNVFKYFAIILPLFRAKNVSNMLRWIVAIYQLKYCHIPQSLNKVLQNLSFIPFSSLTTKHCYQHFIKVAPIIDFFICLETCCQVTSKYENLPVTITAHNSVLLNSNTANCAFVLHCVVYYVKTTKLSCDCYQVGLL